MPPFKQDPNHSTERENPRNLWRSLEGDFYKTPLGDQIKQSLTLNNETIEELNVFPEKYRDLFFVDDNGKIQAKPIALKTGPVASESALDLAWTQKNLEKLLSDKEELNRLDLSEAELIKLDEAQARGAFVSKFTDVSLSMDDVIAGFSSKSLDSPQTTSSYKDHSLRYPVKYRMMPPVEVKDIIFYEGTAHQGAGIVSYVECFSEKNLDEFCDSEKDRVLFSDQEGRQWQISEMVGDTKDNQLGSRNLSPVTLVVYNKKESTYIGFKSTYGYASNLSSSDFVRNPIKELLLQSRFEKSSEENGKNLSEDTVGKLKRKGIYVA